MWTWAIKARIQHKPLAAGWIQPPQDDVVGFILCWVDRWTRAESEEELSEQRSERTQIEPSAPVDSIHVVFQLLCVVFVPRIYLCPILFIILWDSFICSCSGSRRVVRSGYCCCCCYSSRGVSRQLS